MQSASWLLKLEEKLCFLDIGWINEKLQILSARVVKLLSLYISFLKNPPCNG
ncbi:Uncharacterised protein [Serratia proteamaculans]|nr:Uncharacterised protein [Serratia proteamaculans]CAI0959372.1 Uncharacterised protein [Serratia proteamaculans]CAI2087571.1 Uncharacterised protein [Serratia proteamaculans]